MKQTKEGAALGAKQIVAKYGIYLVFLLIFAAMSVARSAFCSPDNIVNILKQASIVSVIAIGQTFCLITGGMDLSASSVMALTGVCSAMYGLADDTNMFMAVVMGLGVGMLCGLVNGIIIAKFHVPAFITTLGMQQAARGMALLVTNARPVFGLSKTYTFLGNGSVLGIPMLVIVMLLVVLCAYIVLEHTRFGRHVYAVGGNEMSAHVSGISVERVQIIVYVIMGALAGLGGLLLSGRLQSGSPTMAEGYELDAIAGAVIGGVSTSGGVGNIVVMFGQMGHDAQIGRYEGLQQAIEGTNIEIIAEQTGNWSREEGMALMENWLASGKEIDAVVAQNDAMALGALMAIEAKNLTGEIKVYGIDAQAEALDAVEKGTMAGTVFQNAEEQGSQCVDVALAAAKGETLEDNYYIPYEGVRADNVADYR